MADFGAFTKIFGLTSCAFRPIAAAAGNNFDDLGNINE